MDIQSKLIVSQEPHLPRDLFIKYRPRNDDIIMVFWSLFNCRLVPVNGQPIRVDLWAF